MVVVSIDAGERQESVGGFCYFIQAVDPCSQERMCDDGGERDLCMQNFPTGQLFPTSNHARRGEEDQPAAKRLRTR